MGSFVPWWGDYGPGRGEGRPTEGGGMLPDVSEASTAIYTEGISPLDTWRSGSSEARSVCDLQDLAGKHPARRSLQGALDGADDIDDDREHALNAEGIRAYGWKDARSASTSASGVVTPFPHTRATSVSLSPELSPANAADPWTTPPMSPFSPITCRDIMQPLLQGAQGATAGAIGHRGVPVHAHAVTQTPERRPSKRGGASSRSKSLSPDASNFHSPDTLFFRYSPATEVPNLSDKSEVSKCPDKSVNRFEAPTVRAFPALNDTANISPKDLNASTFFLDSPISADNRCDSDAGVASGLSWTAAGTLNVEIVQCRNLPHIFGGDPCVHCCVTLHESEERSKVNVLSQLDNPVRETRVHPLSLTAHLLCPQHTTQSAGMSKNLEFRDSFTLERAYALWPVRANRDGEPGLGSVPTLVSLQHRTVVLLITLHDTASQRKDIMSVASLTVTPGAAVDQWFNLFDPDGRRQTDISGVFSAIRISIYFADKEIFHRAPSPLLIQDVSPLRDSERRVQENIVADTAPTHANVSGACIIGMPRANGAAQHVNVKDTSLPPPLQSVTENHRLLLKLVTGVQAKMRRTMVFRWYSAMLIRFSKVITRRPSLEVICRLPSLEVKSEVRKPPTALPGGYTELPNLVDAQDSLELQHAARAGRAHMPTAFEPEPVHSTRSIEPRVVQTRTMDNQPQKIAGKKDVPETTSNVMELVLARSWQNLPHGIVHKSTASDTSSLSLTKHDRRSVSPVYSIGPWNDRKFIEAEAFAKLARRLREHGHEEQAQMYCGEAWNLLQQLKAEEDVGGQYNCVALILNEVERDVSLCASNGSLGSSLNRSLNLDPYSSISTAAGPAATKTNVADLVQNKAAQSSSADARATSAVSPQAAEKDDKRQHREAEVRNSWKKMGKALEDISGALENHVQQVGKSPVQTASPKDSFKSVRKLPAAEAAAIMRQRLGEPVWSPMPSMNSPSHLTGAQNASTAEAAALMRQRLGESAWSPMPSMDSTSQLTGAQNVSTASSKSRSKLMELEETVRLQMRSGQRRSKRKEFEDAANLRRYGDRSASNRCSELTRKILGMHGDTDVSRTSTDDNASTTGSPDSPHDSGVGGGRSGGSGGGERNCMQTLASHGRSPALDELIRACDEDPALQEIRPASLSVRARPLLHDKARLRSFPTRPVISANEREQGEKTGESISPPAPPPRDPKCYAMSVDRMGANGATGDDCPDNGSVRGPGLRLSLIGNEAIQSWLGDAIPGSQKKQGEKISPGLSSLPRSPTFGAKSTKTATEHLLEWTRADRTETLNKRLRVLAKTAEENVAAADGDEISIMA